MKHIALPLRRNTSSPAWLAGFALLLCSCASYTDDTKSLRTKMQSGNYTAALEEIDKSSLASQRRNRVLYLMERGTLLFLDEHYRDAAQSWRSASERSEELYTVSLSSSAASLAVNDSFADYEGELHERVLLPMFAALAHLSEGNLAAARVEARRTDELMKALENAGSNKPEYARDSFAHLLAAMIYEGAEEWDSAIIEYRKGLNLLASSRAAGDKGILKNHFAEPLCRLAKLRNRTDVVKESLAHLPAGSTAAACSSTTPTPTNWRNMAEVIVFYENGRSPIKVAKDIVLPVQGQVVRVSYPSYQSQRYASRGSDVVINGSQRGRTSLVQDIGFLARQSLEARRAKDIIKMTARIIAKDQAARATGRALGPLAGLAASVVGAVTETADTRSWTSLPDEIQVFRTWVDVQALGPQANVSIEPDYGKPKLTKIKLAPGQKIFVRHRSFY